MILYFQSNKRHCLCSLISSYCLVINSTSFDFFVLKMIGKNTLFQNMHFLPVAKQQVDMETFSQSLSILDTAKEE